MMVASWVNGISSTGAATLAGSTLEHTAYSLRLCLLVQLTQTAQYPVPTSTYAAS